MLELMQMFIYVFGICSSLRFLSVSCKTFKDDDIVIKLFNPLSIACLVNMLVAVTIVKQYDVMNPLSALFIYLCYVAGFVLSILIDTAYILFQTYKTYPGLYHSKDIDMFIQKAKELAASRTNYVYEKLNLPRKLF